MTRQDGIPVRVCVPALFQGQQEVGTQARRPPTPAWQFLLPVGTRPLKSISSNSPTWRNLRGDLLPACPPCQIRERPGTLKDLLRVSSSVSVFHRKEVKGGQVTQRACESQTLGQHPCLPLPLHSRAPFFLLSWLDKILET